MFELVKKIVAEIVNICLNIKNAIVGFLPKKDKIVILKDKAKNFIIKLNEKILFLTDKVVVVYNKFVCGKVSLIAEYVKNCFIKAIKYGKWFFFFVCDFYKKDKKRAIFYFIILYIIYKVIFGIVGKFGTFFHTHKNNIIVSVREVKPERVEKNINCYGYLESENNLQYVSEVRGNIEKILVQEKQHVREGQLLMILDSKFTVNAYVSAKSILESKRFQYNAVKNLYSDGLESKGNLKATQADLENAISNFESAKKAYNGLKIYAPFDGYIDNIENKEGSQINIGTKLFTIERMNAMQVKCDVQNISTDEVNVGDNVRVFVNGYEIATGKIAVIGDSIDVDTGSRTILVNKIVGNEGFENDVKPGMSVMMKIAAKSQRDVYKISSEALETTETGAFMVKILNPTNGEISKKNVWLYDEIDGIDYVYGIDENDYVVERGHEFISIGEKGIKYTKVEAKKEASLKNNLYKIWKSCKKIYSFIDEFFRDLPEFYIWSKNYYGGKFLEMKEKFLDLKRDVIIGFNNLASKCLKKN